MTDSVFASDAPAAAPLPRRETLGLPATLLLLLISAIVLIPGMAGVSLFDRDEGWYAQVSREMVESGDWLVPRLYGDVWLAKPPLVYWLVAASYRLFGIGEWQTRLVPALATVINVLLIAKLGTMLYTRRVGVLAGLFFVTCSVMALLAKLLLTDWAMLTCTLAAICCHWRLSFQGSGFRVQGSGMADSKIGRSGTADAFPPLPRGGEGGYAGGHRVSTAINLSSEIRNPKSEIHLLSAVYWLAIGLGILAKGPAILLFCGAFGLALLAVPQHRSWLRSRTWWAWLPLAIFVAAPWFVYIHFKAGDVLASQFLGTEILSRIAHPPKALHPAPPGYHLLLSLPFWLPWTIFIPTALFRAVRAWRTDIAARLLLVWAVLPWLILECIRSKLLWYALPCYVPVAILLARYLDPYLRAGRFWSALDAAPRREFKLWPLVMIALGLVGVVLSFVGWDHGLVIWWDRHWSPVAMITAGVLIAGFVAVRRYQRRSPTTRAAFTIGLLTTFAFYIAVGAWLLPKFEPLRLSRQVGEALAAQARPADRVYICGYDEPTAFFYLKTHPAKLVKKEAMPALLAAAPGPILLAITQGPFENLDPATFDGWRRQPLGQVDGRNYSRNFSPQTIYLERLTRIPTPKSQPASSQPHP